MTWYLLHQQATELIAEREREAQRYRLARLAADAESGGLQRPTAHSGLRHSLARAIHAIGRSVTRAAHALDGDAEVARTA